MLKNVILQHKQEKERLMAEKYVLRAKLSWARRFLDQDLIKVITGARRVGKSIFSILLLQDKNFAYLNFSDENLLKVKNYDEIIKSLFEIYPKAQFILFDEIQYLDKWEIFVAKLKRRGYNLILTGSNAKLLSRELGTALTGRYVPIEILPFSFKEFLKAKKFHLKKIDLKLPETKGRILSLLDEYLQKGSFPEVVVKNLEPKIYLETLFDAILFKDVVKRFKVRFSQKIYDLAVYLISNFTGEFSYNKLKNSLGFRSTTTVQNYLKYLEEAYLFFSLNRFSFKVKEQIRTAKKIYLVDNGLAAAKAFQFSPNHGKLLENLVFIENMRRGYQPNKSLFYYKTKSGKEVDFVLKKGLKVEKLMQVYYEADNSELKPRELKSLIEAGRELKCNNLVVITWDLEKEETIKTKKIRFIPLWKWLLK